MAQTMAQTRPARRSPSPLRRWCGLWLIAAGLLAAGLAWPALYAQAPPESGQPVAPASAAAASGSAPIELDKVIAIINGDVLLESDVQEEMQFAALQPIGSPRTRTQAEAGTRLINRILILQQMKEQQSDIPVTDDDVDKSLADLKKQIPACARFHCETRDGWAAFLKQNNLTEDEVHDRWRQRIQIVNFIDTRFRTGVRVTKPEIQAYYDKRFVPAFDKEGMKAPPVATVSARIEEILLQQRVNVMLQDWLKSLRDQGSVQILDPVYGQGPDTAKDDSGGMQ